MFPRPMHAISLDLFAFPMSSDTLALLAIIFDVFATLCTHFAFTSTFCDLLSISSSLLRFLSISGTLTSTLRPSQHSTSIFAPHRPKTSQIRSEPSQTSDIAPSTCPITMPARCDPSAPHFNPHRPRELRRYIADLVYYLARSDIDDDQEKKRYACYYVDIDTEELWTSLLEYSDRAKSFSDFVHAIYRLYPGSEGQRQWLLADMERLVEERCRIGIRTLGDLGDYYRRFIAITTFLRGTNRLSDIEQSRAFMRGLPSDLRHRVLQRLQLKFIDHCSDDPYRLSDVSDAAQFVLYGTSTSVSITSTPCDPLFDSTLPSLNVSAKNIAEHRTTSRFAQSSSTFDRASRISPETPCCNFCGCPDHFIRQCPDAEEYIRLGRCRRTSEGKIALPTGSFLSRDVPGRFMKFRIDEWHHRNPGHVGSSRYRPRIVPNAVDPARYLRMSSPLRSRVAPTVETSNSGLSIPDRITEIERELDQHRQSTRTTSNTSTLRPSPSHDVQHRSTSHTVPVTSISHCKHSALSPDIPSHSPVLRHNPSLYLTRPHRPITSDLASHIAHRASDIATSTLHSSNVSCATSDVSSSIPVDLARSFGLPRRHIVPYVSDD
jgi:hypothetical protein